MIVAYFVSAVVATVLAAVKGPDFPDLHYWWRWDRGAARAAIGVVWLVYALSAVAVTALADHQDWMVMETAEGRHFANGAAYGVATAILLRLDVASFGLAPFSPARVIFTATMERLSGWLNASADRQVPRAVGDLRPRQLSRGSWRLALRYTVPRLLASGDPRDAPAHLLWLRNLHGVAHQRDEATSLPTPDAELASETLRFYIEELIISKRDSTVRFGEEDPPTA
jgi:hypothetical protein